MRYIMVILMLITSGYASAHEWLPTYPTLKQSFIEGTYVTTMQLFNKRSDVEFYEIKVYDEDFNAVKFGSPTRLLNVKYLKKATVDVYIKHEDRNRAVYICSLSKLSSDQTSITMVASRICSKIK